MEALGPAMRLASGIPRGVTFVLSRRSSCRPYTRGLRRHRAPAVCNRHRRPEARDIGAAVSESRSWMGAGCSVDSWRLVAERGVSPAVVVVRLPAENGETAQAGGYEYRLFVSPVVLGSGTPYFPALDERINLELVETRTFGSRVVYVRYRRV